MPNFQIPGLNRTFSPIDKIQANLDYHAVNPVENPITFEYESTVIGVSSRASAVIEIQFPAQVVENYLISVNDVLVRFKDQPRPGEAPTFATAGSAQDVMEGLYWQLSNDPTLKVLYDFTLSNDKILITAKFEGTQYNIALDQGAGTAFYFANTPGSDGIYAQTKQDYEVMLEVYYDANLSNLNTFCKTPAPVQISQCLWVKLGELSKKYSGINKFSFDVSEFLKPHARTIPPFCPENAPDFAKFEYADLMLGRYAVRTWQLYSENGIQKNKVLEQFGFGEERVNQILNQSYYAPEQLWWVNSAMPTQYPDEQIYSDFRAYWRRKTGGNPSAVYPLTSQPEVKTIDVRQFEWLYFLYDRSEITQNTLATRFDFYFEDGSQLLAQYLPAYIVSNNYLDRAGGAYYVEVSPRCFDYQALEQNQGSLLKKYAVTVVEWDGNGSLALNSTPVTTTQVYLLRNHERCLNQWGQLLFLNRLGGFDTLYPSAYSEYSLQAKYSEYKRNMIHDSLTLKDNTQVTDYAKVSENGQYNVENELVISMQSGWVDASHYNWLKDLCNSTQVFIIDPFRVEFRTGAQLLPRLCNILKTSWQQNEGGTMFNLSIELKLGYPLNLVRQ